MVAMQIAREPLVRHVLRQTFQERAKVNIKPTKKGKKVCSKDFYSTRLLTGPPVMGLVHRFIWIETSVCAGVAVVGEVP